MLDDVEAHGLDCWAGGGAIPNELLGGTELLPGGGFRENEVLCVLDKVGRWPIDMFDIDEFIMLVPPNPGPEEPNVEVLDE
jgi:hypothetical protein